MPKVRSRIVTAAVAAAIITSPDPAFVNPLPGWGFGIGGIWIGI